MNLTNSMRDKVRQLLEKGINPEQFTRCFEVISNIPKRSGGFGTVHKASCIFRPQSFDDSHNVEVGKEYAIKEVSLIYDTDCSSDERVKISKIRGTTSKDSDRVYRFLSACQEAVLHSHLKHNQMTYCLCSWIEPRDQAALSVDVDDLMKIVNSESIDSSELRRLMLATAGMKIYMVMDWFDSNLKDFITKNIPSKKVLSGIVKQLVNVLKYVHDNRYVHRDVKPENILVKTQTTNQGESNHNKSKEEEVTICLADFGLCVRDYQRKSGTYPYNSYPEKGVSHKSDIWSLGVTIYEMYYLRSTSHRDLKPQALMLEHLVQKASESPHTLSTFIGKTARMKKKIKKVVCGCLSVPYEIRPDSLTLMEMLDIKADVPTTVNLI